MVEVSLAALFVVLEHVVAAQIEKFKAIHTIRSNHITVSSTQILPAEEAVRNCFLHASCYHSPTVAMLLYEHDQCSIFLPAAVQVSQFK